MRITIETKDFDLEKKLSMKGAFLKSREYRLMAWRGKTGKAFPESAQEFTAAAIESDTNVVQALKEMENGDKVKVETSVQKGIQKLIKEYQEKLDVGTGNTIPRLTKEIS